MTPQMVEGSGYGRIWIKPRPQKAHRLALVLSGIAPPFEGAVARHRCHNRRCCNPAHLRWGTHRDNMQDCVRAGRHHATKLTPEAIAHIRQSREPGSILARQFGVSEGSISRTRKSNAA
jgi:hypothetical protein